VPRSPLNSVEIPAKAVNPLQAVPSDDPRDDIPSAEGPEDFGLAEDAGRGTDIDLDVTTRQEKKAGAEATGTPPQRQPLQWLDMSNWDSEPVPQRKWAIDRVPLNQAGLFSGEGGTGKSIIELMKNVAHVTGKDWLGSMPELGPATTSEPRTRRTRFTSNVRAMACPGRRRLSHGDGTKSRTATLRRHRLQRVQSMKGDENERYQTGIKAHDDTCIAAEMNRQTAVAAAIAAGGVVQSAGRRSRSIAALLQAVSPTVYPSATSPRRFAILGRADFEALRFFLFERMF
jgi:hypothetical protein